MHDNPYRAEGGVMADEVRIRCTDRARKTLRVAAALSRQRGHSDIEGHDILDALSHDGGVAGAALQYSGYQAVALPSNLPHVDDQEVATTNLRELMIEAMVETKQLTHNYAGGQHLLLALMRTQPELVPDPDGVIQEVLDLLGERD